MNSTQTAPALVTFKAGMIVSCRSICDHNCVWTYLVKSRTASRVTLEQVGKAGTKTVGIKVWDGVETCKPQGTFSMCPVLRAS